MYFAISDNEKRANERRNGVKGLWTYWEGVMGVDRYRRYQDANRAGAFSGSHLRDDVALFSGAAPMTRGYLPVSAPQAFICTAPCVFLLESSDEFAQRPPNQRFPESAKLAIYFQFLSSFYPLPSCKLFGVRMANLTGLLSNG
ncbi:hypothetical protein [Paraburkholderia tropica]|uniref:hypothetical protein n=1 Tax=Paraburkholderia tropica TaxID=92647 RepID=UPI00160A9C69|nr:hypothetical protein [Paraburkholderia tropica]MBB2983190.1 hypothetical protein [Paraburkholderia tropica]